MALPDCTDRTLTWSSVNPTWGLIIVVAALSAVVVSALRTVDHLSTLETAARCVSGGGDVLS